MKIVDAAGPLGMTITHRVVKLTAKERKILERARDIADEIREEIRKVYGEVEAEDMEQDTQVAGVEHGIADILEGIELPK